MPLKFIIPALLGSTRGVAGAISYDADAQTFFTTAGITDTTQKNALNQLVLDWKAAGLWATKIIAAYPIVGGAASPCSFNLRNPSLFQIAWTGSPAFTSNGVDFDGTTQFGDTGLSFSSLTNNSTHIAYYSRENITRAEAEMGIANSASERLLMHTKYSDGNSYFDHYGANTARITTVITSSTGLFVSSRISSSDVRAFYNGSQVGSTNTGFAETFPTSNNVFLGATSGAFRNYTTKQCAFASIGLGLTATDVSNLYTSVQNFQTTLGRQV